MDLPISVIVPIYNAGCFLPSCIESILAQTFSNFELLLVDDGSTDTSLDICTRYAKADARITVFHKENEGVTATRKYGVEMAKGEYICFVDADDALPANSLQDLHIVRNDADIVIGAYKEISANKERLHTITSVPTEFTGIDYIRFQLENKLFHGPCAKLIKKTCFDETTLDIPHTIFRGEDFLMNLRLGKNARKIRIVNTVTYYYIIRDSSCMMTRKPTLVYEKLFDSYLTASLSDKQLCTSLKASVLHQRAEAISGLFLAKCNIDLKDEFVQSVYQASKISSLNISQILIRTMLHHPSLYRLIYRVARKLRQVLNNKTQQTSVYNKIINKI